MTDIANKSLDKSSDNSPANTLNDNPVVVDALICPLCHKHNACVNLGCADVEQTCWCNNPEISFPKGLLEKLPKEKRGQACICQACALAYQKEHNASFYPVK